MPGARSPPGSFHDSDIILFGNLFLISVVSLAHGLYDVRDEREGAHIVEDIVLRLLAWLLEYRPHRDIGGAGGMVPAASDNVRPRPAGLLADIGRMRSVPGKCQTRIGWTFLLDHLSRQPSDQLRGTWPAKILEQLPENPCGILLTMGYRLRRLIESLKYRCSLFSGWSQGMADLLQTCEKLEIGDGRGRISIPFIGHGNIWIENGYDADTMKLVRYVILSALKGTAPGQLCIDAYDSNLSGVFAPYAQLSQGEPRQLTFIGSAKGLSDYLGYLKQEILDVQNVIQGRAGSLVEFRETVRRPVEGYRLVVISAEMSRLSSEMREELRILFRAGPAAGISFVIVSGSKVSAKRSDGGESLLPWYFFTPQTQTKLLSAKGGMVTQWNLEHRAGNETAQALLPDLPVESIISYCSSYMASVMNQEMPVITMESIQDFRKPWTESSIDGLTFTIGKCGVNDMSVTIGDELNQRHNAVITGAVGQGKSNLISVIVHSLCERYSPDELELYMLDFKEGVSLKPYANIGQMEYLPHARALGLESDIPFGIAVLESLFRIYRQRMEVLKRNDVRSIREFRLKTHERMPRILVVIDEFQMMFEGSRESAEQAADLLEKSVRLFRAAGIHFILASQTLSGNVEFTQHRDNIFSQIPIRIALKNSVRESQETLSLSNPAAAFLRPREAIVNLDYGEPSQNQKTVIAYADESFLKPLRRKWWVFDGDAHPAPYVFERNRRAYVSSSLASIAQRRQKTVVPAAFLGQHISVPQSEVAIPLPDEPGRNIAILGSPDHGCNNAQGMLQSVAVSLALQHPASDERFLFCDFSPDREAYSVRHPAFSKAMAACGCQIEDIAPADFAKTIADLAAASQNRRTYVFAAFMDRWTFEGRQSPLKELVEKGPSLGIHFIGWWTKENAFERSLGAFGSDGLSAFNTRVFLRISERSVKGLTNPYVRWAPQDNRALISDEVEMDHECTFVPFAPIRMEDAETCVSFMSKQR